MAEFFRFLVEDPRPVTLIELEEALHAEDARFTLAATGRVSAAARFAHGDTLLGALAIHRRGDDAFDREIEFQRRLLDSYAAGGKHRKLGAVIDAVTAIVVLTIPDGRPLTEESVETLTPLWKWLFVSRGGLLQTPDGLYAKKPTKRVVRFR